MDVTNIYRTFIKYTIKTIFEAVTQYPLFRLNAKAGEQTVLESGNRQYK